MKIKHLPLLLIILCFQYTGANATDNCSSTVNFTHLCTLLNARFELMKDVAAYKYKNKLAIEDKKREQTVLNNSIHQATNYGLSTKTVKQFFETQITISKHLQESWISYWNTTNFPKEYVPLDLKTQIRPKLTIIDNKIILALKALHSVNKIDLKIQKEIINNTVNVKFINGPEREKILESITVLINN